MLDDVFLNQANNLLEKVLEDVKISDQLKSDIEKHLKNELL